ncbi:BMC domain-containing protein [Brevibacillus sp. AY1]|uniref:BMC domain-containing protein n=1 Tax=Brevibacillus sp. AY1 TaxID=2807621 RepID=UPI002455FE64|nr:BMC domain-containing protein [Brevibacillus sp. AY1]MDH4617480.1 BMC domain-containing protein [Brevibacillus sp. AY1]
MNVQAYALGMIETLGLPALVAAADAAAKAADVRVVAYEGVDAGIVTVYVIGDVSSVQAAVEAGSEAARRVGRLLHSHVIPRPDDQVPKLIRQLANPPSKEESPPTKTKATGKKSDRDRQETAQTQDEGGELTS